MTNHHSAPAIAVCGLTKSYREVPAVRGITFEVPSGEVCALLGRNGAGKTTTLECLAGLRVPDDGTVAIAGLDPRADRDAVMARLGVMLQEGGAYPAATPEEMLRLHARFHADPADPEALLTQLGLGDVAGAPYRTLSGGEKQRVKLALALVGRPEIALLDEPTAGMDPHGRREVWTWLESLVADGLTVLLATHAMDEAERLAARAAVIERGRLVACEPPEVLVAREAPDTRRLEDAYLRLTNRTETP